jgi:hypothetical protein
MDPTVKMHEWQDLTVDNLLGGLVLDAESELLENNEFPRIESWVMREKRLKRDTGYAPYLAPVRGSPRRHFSYVLPSGDLHELLITDATVYRQFNDQWQYVSDGIDTTLSGAEAAGQVALSVTDITGFSDDDYVGIMLDTGQMHMTRINGAPAAGVITVDDALPSAAASGNDVVKAVDLNGVAQRHVTAIALPWNNWCVFTNGVDNLKRFDPTALTVVNVPGLVDTSCQALALYDNSIIIANTTESGVRFPFRFRYCAKGDATLWTTLEAGYTDILDSSNDILQALPLGPDLVLYRDKSIARVSISSSGVRRFDTITAVSGVGIFSNIGVIDLIDRHIVWGNNDFYWYRGGFSVEPIGTPIKDYVFGPAGVLTVAPSRGQAFAVLLPQVNEILFFNRTQVIPEVANEVLRYHLDYNKWTKRTFAQTICGYGEHIISDSDSWSDLVGGWQDQVSNWTGFESSGERYAVALCSVDNLQSNIYDYQTPNDGGTAITAVLETKDFSDPVFMVRTDWFDVSFANGTITLEASIDKGQSWIALGTATNGGVVAQRSRFWKQLAGRTVRFRITTTDPVSLIFFGLRFKYEFEW